MRVAVVGAGVVGMSTAVELVERGHSVTCYESGPIMGERSAGATRIFRLAHVDPDLVRLAIAARREFARWGAAAGRPMLVDSECVITGTDMADRAAAMATAGAEYLLAGAGSGRLRLPVVEEPAAALVDPAGGVVDVDAVRAHLTALAGHAVTRERVFALEITGAAVAVTSSGGRAEHDALVIAAGADTAHLAAQVGICTPPLIGHHARFTFRAPDAPWQAWIDQPRDVSGTYQHAAGPGLWAVGGHVDPAETAWERGREAAVEASRLAALDYARRYLAVEPVIVDTLYCVTMPQHGDGAVFARNGPVVTLYGNNLMKLAPVLGSALATAAVDGSTPTVPELAAAV